MKKRVDEKDVYYNIDGQEIDFSDYNIQEKITYESANFIRRMCAFGVDFLIIICIWYVCSISTFNKLNDFVSQLGINPSDFTNPQILLEFARLYHQSIIKLIFIFYFVQTVYFTLVPAIIGCGQTIGKLLAGIGVVDARTLNELKPLQLIFREFVCRTLLETVLIIPLIISIGISFFRDDSKSLHDILSSSVVIKMDMYNVE